MRQAFGTCLSCFWASGRFRRLEAAVEQSKNKQQTLSPIVVRPFVDRVPFVASALELYDGLEATGIDCPVLLETCDAAQGSSERSVLVVRTPLRLNLLRTRATVLALEAGASPLLEAFGRAFGQSLQRGQGTSAAGRDPRQSVVIDFDHDPGEASCSDRDRLRMPTPLDALRVFSRLVSDDGADAQMPPAAFGAIGYEFVDAFEALPERGEGGDAIDASLVLGLDTIVIDHARGRAEIVTRGLPWESHSTLRQRQLELSELVHGIGARGVKPGNAASKSTAASSSTATSNARAGIAQIGPGDRKPAPANDMLAPQVHEHVTRGDFEAGVERILQHIRAGDVFQTVLSRSFDITSDAAPIEVYRELRRLNPSPYMFHIELGDAVLLGASPETFVSVKDGYVEVKPIAGTAARGRAPDHSIDRELDGRLALALRLDPKEQAEHAMLLDLARNDVARVCEPGSTEVIEQFELERFGRVQHLVSRVRGRLAEGFDALHAYRACANPGTLTGAPKLKAMELIRAQERRARGFYGGACGYLTSDGQLDTCIVIRSLHYSGGVYSARAGAGIVADSQASREYEETLQKSRSVLEAIAAAEHRLQNLQSGEPGPGESLHVVRAGLAGANSASSREHEASPHRSNAGPACEGPPRVLVIDHEDSFVFNLVEEFARLGCTTEVVRCRMRRDQLEAWLDRFDPDLVLLSPGPGTPDSSGVTLSWLREFPRRPILGVCLGHQAIAEACGARITRAAQPVHGRAHELDTSDDALFAGHGETRLVAARYHSLIAEELPECLQTIATCTSHGQELVMATRHRELPWIGLQFHPESYLTPSGSTLIARILDEAKNFRAGCSSKSKVTSPPTASQKSPTGAER